MAIYSVSQVAGYLNDLLYQDSALQDIWVSGEVANLARPGSGNSYFTLRDSGSTLRCAMFSRSSRGAELLANGMSVIAHGRVSLYEARGDLQLVADVVQPEGVGDLQMKLEQLIAKLESEGLFSQSRKREIPRYPRRVVAVTSPIGSVWQDIKSVVERRYPLAELSLVPVMVQGDRAAATIVDGLAALDTEPDVDVVILARGGGSLEDLWPFNEEAVARAIFRCSVPLISAVGHETDTTVADMVADVRAPTPSVAAEIAVPDQAELSAGLLAMRRTLTSAVSRTLLHRTEVLRRLGPRLLRVGPGLDQKRIRVDELLRRASMNLRQNLEARTVSTEAFSMRLRDLSPKDTLRRGYAIVQIVDESTVVSDPGQVSVGDGVEITLAQGSLSADVVTPRTLRAPKGRVDDPA
ncbi:MAG: exodeoxyribonuclease VII large subunit [SAR202 cluster bacterium]|nr:exodeoxyribonuclease VII large subunit [SAR202 cluster bacterium]